MQLIIVHRLLQAILLPPVNSMLLMFLSFILPSRKVRPKKVLAIFGFLSLYLQATPIFSYNLAKSIEPKPFIAPENYTPDAIIILSGGINSNGYEYPVHATENTDTFIRLRYATFLAHKYPNTTLILSGGYAGSHYKEADVMHNTLESIFSVDNPIIVENNSRNTNENAKFTANIIKQNDFKQILLVTQAYHMRRALMLFQQNGIYPIAAATDYTCSDNARTKALRFIPTAHALATTARTLHEIIGYYLYKLDYFIAGGTKQFLDYL